MTTRQTPDAVREAVARETLAKQYDASMPSRAAHIRAGTSDHKAIDAILAFAALDSRAGDADEFATVEEWEHDDQRELSRLYNHKAHDGPQFNRGQMRVAIRHGKRLAAPAVDAVPAGEVRNLRPNLGAETDEPSLEEMVLDYYRRHYPIGEAFNLRDRYFDALSHGEGRK